MNQTSRTIPLDQAKPGMVLAEAVRQKDGGLLLPCSIELGESHIVSLLRRDIKEITIVAQQSEEELAAVTAKREALQEAIRLQVQHLFRKAEMNATTQALMQTVLDFRQEEIL